MHVVFLCNEYPPGRHGGIGVFTQTLARACVAAGHCVTVVGLYRINQHLTEDDLGVRVIRVPNTSIRGSGFLVNGMRLRRALAEIHRRQPIDLIEGPENSLAFLSSKSRIP